MPIPNSYLPAMLSLTAVGAWGTSDFLGGIGARRGNVFLFTSLVHLSGMLLAGGLALTIGLPFPDANSVYWSLAAGAIGGIGLALFYRGLAVGKMGIVAPVSAVLGAAIATAVAAFTEGVPSNRHLVGFVLAGIGVWLISRTEENAEGGSEGEGGTNGGRPKGLGLAILSGCGFAGFFFCIHRAGQGSALWIAVCSRFASFIVTVAIVVASRQFRALARPVLAIAVAAGILEITGSVVFVRASQIGRLDATVVLSSLYPAVTVILARIFLREHFSRARTIGMLAALAAVPMIAG
ncbi:MAG: EamA family transporter [Terriglobales bacterium]